MSYSFLLNLLFRSYQIRIVLKNISYPYIIFFLRIIVWAFADYFAQSFYPFRISIQSRHDFKLFTSVCNKIVAAGFRQFLKCFKTVYGERGWNDQNFLFSLTCKISKYIFQIRFKPWIFPHAWDRKSVV